MSLTFKDDYYRLHIIDMIQKEAEDIFTDDVLTQIIESAKEKNYSTYTSLAASYVNIKENVKASSLSDFFDDVYTIMQKNTLMLDSTLTDAFKLLYEKWNKNLINLWADMPRLFQRPIYYRNSLDINSGYYTITCFRSYTENSEKDKSYQLQYIVTGNALNYVESPLIIGNVVGRGYTTSHVIKCLEKEYTTESSMSCISSCLQNPHFKLRSMQTRSKKAQKTLCMKEKDVCKCTKFAKVEPSDYILWCVWLHTILSSIENNPKYEFLLNKIDRKSIETDNEWGFRADIWYMQKNYENYMFSEEEIDKFISLLTEDNFFAFNSDIDKCVEHLHKEQLLEHNRADEKDNITPIWVNGGHKLHRETVIPDPQSVYQPLYLRLYESDDYNYVKLHLLPDHTKLEPNMVDSYYVYQDKHTNELKYFIEYYSIEYKEKKESEFNIIEQEYFNILVDFLTQYGNTQDIQSNDNLDLDKYFL